LTEIKQFRMRAATLRHRMSAPGIVQLVGAGPGSADLLTLRALRALEAADVVLYDQLVSPEVLALARRGAQRLDVGKRCGKHALDQGTINALLVRLAREGKRVVRLKGGDPSIFGRAGEEIAALAAQGIAFEVIPGVTAASAAAACAAIPLTHRDSAQACVFVTGHLKNGSLDLDWEALARPRQTVVVYMAANGLAQICRQLAAHGLAAETPAALVESATLPGERVLQGTLATLPALAAAEGVRAPAILVVGEVVRLRAAARPAAPRERESLAALTIAD
jgi:uroporphyrin-III C-methyltransferase/precorrin-2 dehydrogenase/sirohydrochlorin ferrochelatase